ncbi:phosphotransferase [Streptomyces sp. NRRL F-5650]|uniref:phosphotransferase n=1 Tax=Streptomyces sp. NRRL F-5650 TaxID=1463868 RepID=UPI000D1A11D1|nr:phosphotransferase [Streptomyces sp. NRRL F-5650]
MPPGHRPWIAGDLAGHGVPLQLLDQHPPTTLPPASVARRCGLWRLEGFPRWSKAWRSQCTACGSEVLPAAVHQCLAGRFPVMCHEDPGPTNVVFRDGVPTALIDFDAAAPAPCWRTSARWRGSVLRAQHVS